MRVFLSWSGQRSRGVAECLHDWLPVVIQAVQPWMSAVDVHAGARWGAEVAYALNDSRFGVLSLTPENLNAPWVLFEAGALSRTVSEALVCPYLVGFEASSLFGPLSQFQAVTADKAGTWQLVQAINRATGDIAVPEPRLARTFDAFWPDLQACMEKAQEAFESVRYFASAPAASTRAPDADAATLETLLRRLNETDTAATPAPTSGVDFVFLAHGRDHGQREAVARTIEQLGARVIILDQRPNSGLTIDEKLEKYTDVRYAVVLMTPDDIGRYGASSEMGARARQNVVLELGYLLAKLGRSRVCVLRDSTVEMPSDYSGVLYIPLDQGGAWRFLLARELTTAGVQVNVNNLL